MLEMRGPSRALRRDHVRHGGQALAHDLGLLTLTFYICTAQVEGIQRLATLLQQIAEARGSGAVAGLRAGSAEQSAAMLRWLVAEAASLSPDARAQAFWYAVSPPSRAVQALVTSVEGLVL